MSDPQTIGELIRERRLASGLSLGQLATAVGRTAATVRSWERGQHSPAPDVLGRLATALKVEQGDLEEVLYREPPSLTVVADETDDEVITESTSVSGEASVETADGEGDDDTAEVGPVESAPAAAAGAETDFVAASADELGVMPRIEVPAEASAPPDADDDEAPVEVEIVAPEEEADADPVAELPDEPGTEDALEGATDGEAVLVEPDITDVPTVEDDVVEVTLDEPDDALTLDEASDADEAGDADESDLRPLVDEPTAAIGPPIASAPPTESGHVGVAVKAEMLQEPSLPPFLAPLRAIFDPSRKWLYWIRGSLTVVAMVIMLLVLAWAAGELFDGLGEVLDTIESTDEVASSLDI